jgi:hypothetical protein
VLAEVKRDPVTKNIYSKTHHPLNRLPTEITDLTELEWSIFIDLVSAPARDRLGDGEAAAIAVAACRKIAVVIDERKARRVLRERFSQIALFRSVDLLRSSEVLAQLGPHRLEECFDRARQFGRMHVS